MLIPSGYAQANMIYTGLAAPTGAQWTLGLDVTLFAGEPADVAALLIAHINSSDLLQEYSSASLISSILVKFGPNATGPSALVGTSIGGGQGSAAAPPNTAVLVHKLTSQGGRAGRGRCYIPSPLDTDIDSGGVWAAANVTQQNLRWEDFRDKLQADDIPAVVLHGVGSPLTLPTFIDSFSVQSKVATQRRRLRR